MNSIFESTATIFSLIKKPGIENYEFYFLGMTEDNSNVFWTSDLNLGKRFPVGEAESNDFFAETFLKVTDPESPIYQDLIKRIEPPYREDAEIYVGKFRLHLDVLPGTVVRKIKKGKPTDVDLQELSGI